MSGNYNRKDHLYEKAKAEGYRSRASYKLKELIRDHKLIKHGSKVLDLGAWPGGWLQVAGEAMGASGVAVGIDLVELEGFDDSRIHIITGDAREEENLKKATTLAGGKFDVIISDMSPKLTGIPEVDRTAAVGLNELALWVSGVVLREGGSLTMKVFKGNETEQFIRSLRPLFENKVIRTELDATRKTSNEFYVVASGFKGIPN